MNYEDVLSLIKNKQENLGVKPGLERIKFALAELDNPQNHIKAIHIAGTNGKGSIASGISNSLIAAGYTVGLFTSPWVIDICEQIQVNHSFISHEKLSVLVERVNNICPELTEFELFTAVAFEYFSELNVNYMVIECGMGGELDSTNVIDNTLISVITEISLDHTEYLGNSLLEIAKNKAGIIKENSTVVLYPNHCLDSFFTSVCEEKNAKLRMVPDLGDVGKNNSKTIEVCLKSLGINIPVMPSTMPARLERINGNVLLDGSHNNSSVKVLAEYLRNNKINGVAAVVSIMNDKNAEEYIKSISMFCASICICRSTNNRAIDCTELLHIAKKYCNSVNIIKNPVDAVKHAINTGRFVLVCGSLYLARDVRRFLLECKT